MLQTFTANPEITAMSYVREICRKKGSNTLSFPVFHFSPNGRRVNKHFRREGFHFPPNGLRPPNGRFWPPNGRLSAEWTMFGRRMGDEARRMGDVPRRMDHDPAEWTTVHLKIMAAEWTTISFFVKFDALA